VSKLGTVLAFGTLLALSACKGRGRGSPDGSPGAAAGDPLAPLHAFEEERRRTADFAHLPPSDRSLGPDPIAIRELPGRGSSARRFVGLLRGRDALVLLDAGLHEIARTPAPALPTGLAVTEDGEIAVSGEQSPAIFRYRVEGDAFRVTPEPPFAPDVPGLRDVALSRSGDVEYAVDERAGTVRARATKTGGPSKVVPACAGAFRVERAGDQLVVDCLLEHTLAVFDLDREGMPADAPRALIHHDGPIWSFDAAAAGEALLIAAGGVEDHPLDRTEGSFGFIDSFVFLYRVPRRGEPERLAAVNVSELGVITPKAIALRLLPGGGAAATAAGYGSDRLVEVSWASDLTAPPSVVTRPILPGAASMAGDGELLVFADPLLDAWFALPAAPATAPPPVAALDPVFAARSFASRVGEALFFTNLMAPWDSSEGRLSRFTCETCHFEGYGDGRIHHTGRGDVIATTKPLLGLFNNRPHFSRALDPDMAVMVNNEFRVAGALSGHDPWFTMAQVPLSWTPLLGPPAAGLDALGLRQALMTFLMDFTHRPNPAVLGRLGAEGGPPPSAPATLTERERRGAEVFAQRCEHCHEARLVTDEPASRVPPSRWEALVLSREGPIVWATKGYWKTGIEPYVHELGARPPSLRRVYKKYPYFTNGSAKSLREVLERARFRGEEFWHDKAPEGTSGLADEEREALLAWLNLL
jgi:Cytochrome c